MASKKIKSSLVNMILSLFFISIGMAAALGYVYNITKEPIAQVDMQKELAALKEVLPEFNNEPTKEKIEENGITLYPAKKDGNLVGVAVKTYTDKGFSGRFDLMVGFLPDGSINNIAVVKQNETPGLGTKMKEPKFKDQFKGKNPEKNKLLVKKDQGEIDAITASTITSRAFCDAVQKGYDVYKVKYSATQTVEADTTIKEVTDTISKGGIK